MILWRISHQCVIKKFCGFSAHEIYELLLNPFVFFVCFVGKQTLSVRFQKNYCD